MLDFVFGSATNKAIQTMSSMSFWQMSTLSLLYYERCCSRIEYMWENNYENRLFGKTLFYSWKELGNSEASINFFRLQKIHYLFFCKKIPNRTSFSAIKQLFPLIYSLITFGNEVDLVLKVISVTIFLYFNSYIQQKLVKLYSSKKKF